MDIYMGSATGQWHFDNAAFTAEMAGGTITIAGSPTAALNGSYTIGTVDTATEVTLDPVPAIAEATAVEAVTVGLSYTPAVQFLAGPAIVGVALIPQVKEGANKLGSNRRAT